MFLHLLRPDRKFFEPIRRVFEAAAPGQNCWVVVGPIDDGFVLPAGANHVMTRRELRDALPTGVQWEGVVLNGLTFATAGSMIRGVPTSVPVAWYVWGYEAYGYWEGLRSALLLPQTQLLRDQLEGLDRRRKTIVRSARRRRTDRDALRLLDRLDFCVGPLREERELFVAAGLHARTQYHPGLVGCLDDYVAADGARECGDEVQLGNSATLSNNHLDALSVLSASGLGSRRVIAPLGYGDPLYRDAVAAYGREMLGERFHPLVEFIPKDEYLKVISSCGHVVMNHLRQQALGNIFASLWRGARVYMNDTTAYRGLKRVGFDVRLISRELAGTDGLRFDPTPQKDAAHHRDLLRELYAFPTVVEETRGLLERLRAMAIARQQVWRRVER